MYSFSCISVCLYNIIVRLLYSTIKLYVIMVVYKYRILLLFIIITTPALCDKSNGLRLSEKPTVVYVEIYLVRLGPVDQGKLVSGTFFNGIKCRWPTYM